MKRVVLIIIDSVGIGKMPDEERFGDKNVDTLGNIVRAHPDIKLPNLQKLGIFNIDNMDLNLEIENPIGSFGRLFEVSEGKDTTTGHWEIAGLKIDVPFKTFPDGFPKEVIDEFERRTGRKALFNKPASGTVIIEQLGKEHMETGDPIVYTSADSVFQIATHEDIIPIDELYKMCEIAREILMGDYQIARVIARPFVGKPGAFERTPNRRDYSLSPFGDTILDNIKNDNKDVIAVGKIVDIYNGQGITEDVHTVSNMDGVDQTIKYMKEKNEGIIFTNLVDFDAKFGHRRNSLGYKEALEEFDQRLPEILSNLKDDDVLMITADHGNDPTYKGTDHTRETVPLLVYGKNIKANVNLGDRTSFSDIAAFIGEYLEVKMPEFGISFKNKIVK